MNIQIADLEFSYPNGAPVLRDLSLEIHTGTQLALLGQNGAGKTTLVKQFNGLLKPSRGIVQVGEWKTQEHSIAELARRVGFVFQNPDDQLFKSSVEEEVAFGPMNLNLDPSQVSERVERALQSCALLEQRKMHPYDLQAWQRRWVAIASVIAMQTPVIVLDEPTTGQDAFGLALLESLLAECKRAGVTVIAVTHDVDFAVEHFEEIMIMAQGRVVARGDAKAFADEAMLSQAGLRAPQLMRLAHALQLEGTPATVEAFVSLFADRRLSL